MRISNIVYNLAALSAAYGTTIPRDLARLATRGDPTKEAILGALQTFVTDFSYPRFVEIAKNVTYSGFSDDVVGRIDVTQEYTGNELNTEYIFGLASSCAQLNTTLILGYVLNQTVLDLSIDTPVASVNTLSYYDFKGKIGAVPVLLNTWFRFDDNNKIVSWDGIIGRFSWLMDTLKPSIGESIANELNISGPDAANYDQLIHQRAALDICSVHQTYCHGQDQQYADYDECIDTILNKKPLGDWWAMGIDNALCRWIHMGMVQFRPSVHCPHIGPTGGDMCNPRTYEAAALTNPFTAPFMPSS